MSEPTTLSPSSKPAKRSKRGRAVMIMLLLALGGTSYWYLHRDEIGTDDATIESWVVPIAPKVGGYVSKLNVIDNQQIKAGDVIAQIDPRDYEIALTKAQSALDSAQAKLDAANHEFERTKVSAPMSVSSAEAELAAANADWQRAQSQRSRMEKLSDAARSRQELDAAIAAEKATRATVADAKAKLSTAQTAPNSVASAAANIKELEAQIETAKAQVEQAKKDLVDTKIIAPMDGHVSKRTVEQGSYLQAGQRIMSLVSNEYWVVANYKETQLTRIKPGQKAMIEIDAYPGKSYAAHVDSIQRGTGARFSTFPPENATGNFVKIVQRVPVKLVFDERPAPELAVGPGMSVAPTVMVQ